MARVGAFIGVIIASLLFAHSAANAQQSNVDLCTKTEAEGQDALAKGIAACTALLDNSSVTGPDRAMLYLSRGNSYLRSWENSARRKAVADFLKVIEISPDSTTAAEAYYKLGEVYAPADDLGPDPKAKAIGYLQSALKLGLKDAEKEGALHGLAKLYDDLGDPENALIYLNQYLELEPGDMIERYHRGEIYYGMAGPVGFPVKDPALLDKAIADYDTVLTVCAAHPRACYVGNSPEEVKNSRGEAYVQKGELDKALADFASVAKTEYASSNAAHYGLGLVYAEKGEYAKALAEYDLIVSKGGMATEYYYQRGLVYEKSGNRDKAIADYQTALLQSIEMSDFYQGRIGNLAKAALIRLGARPAVNVGQ